MSVNAKMTAIADEIRAKTGVAEPLTLDDMAENVPKVYEAGKKAEYDAFWDALQNYGERVNYNRAFASGSWGKKSFKPKYSMKPTSMENAFSTVALNEGDLDFVDVFEKQGITFDTSDCTDWTYAFANSGIVRLGEINVVGRNISPQSFFYCRNLHTIENLIVDENTTFGAYTFEGNNELKNLKITGIIGKTGCTLKNPTKLTKESITSVINALSPTTSGLTVTFSKTAVNNAFETATGAADGTTSQEWADLIATKSNWTISLV